MQDHPGRIDYLMENRLLPNGESFLGLSQNGLLIWHAEVWIGPPVETNCIQAESQRIQRERPPEGCNQILGLRRLQELLNRRKSLKTDHIRRPVAGASGPALASESGTRS